MIRTVYFYILLWTGLALTLPALAIVELLNLFSNEKAEALAQRVAMTWGRSVIEISGSKVEVSGLENIPAEGPVIFIPNHQSNFDIPLLLGYVDRPMGFLAKEEIRKIPIVGRWMKHLNCVFIDRSNPRDALRAMSLAAKTVKEGHPLCIFPEGTRSGVQTMGEFKPGAFKIYTKTRAEVLPVAIDGTWRIQGRDTLGVKASHVKLSVLKPMDFGEDNIRDTQVIAEKVKSQIMEKIEKKLN